MKKRAKKQSANENIAVTAVTPEEAIGIGGQACAQNNFAQTLAGQLPAEGYAEFRQREEAARLAELDAKLALLRKHKVAKFTEGHVVIEFDRAAFIEPKPPREDKPDRDPHFDPEDEEQGD